MRRASRFAVTFPVSYANGDVGYVPTEEAFSPSGGGYETRLTSYSNLAIDAGKRITEGCLDLASALHPGAMPEPPRAPAFGSSGGPQAWSYGNLPPELS